VQTGKQIDGLQRLKHLVTNAN